MPRKASTTKPILAIVSDDKPKGKGMTFTMEVVDRSTMPQPAKRGGRTSNVPAIEAFLAAVDKPGVTYEMKSADSDGGHPVNRVTQIRKIAGERFKVETAPIESGKRYRVFITLAT